MGRKLAALALTLALGLTARETFAQSGIFRSSLLSSMGSSPTAAAAGDYDGDGALDMVATNAGPGGNSVVVAIGFSDGTLSAFPALPVGSFPSDLIARHFDADNLDDLVVANTNDSTVVFLRGTGSRDCLPNGSPDCSRFFASPGPPIEVGSGPRGLAAADINGDGDIDIAVANEGPADGSLGTLSILLGQGNGTFVRVDQDPNDVEMLVNDLPTELGTTRAALGDVSGDDVVDALALNTISGTVSVFFGNGDGTFALGVTETVDGAADLALGDLNGDGDLDMATADNNSDSMSVRLGAGDGTFGAPTTYRTGTAPLRVAVSDVDGDGDLDVVTANSRSQDVTYFAGAGDGSFAAGRTFVADAEPRAVTFGDFNDDGRGDVGVVSEGRDGATAAVLLGREDGLLQAAEDLAAGGAPTAFAVGDVDGNAVADLVAVTDNGTMLVYRAREGGLGAAETKQIGGRPRGIALADLSGDKRLDIAVADIDGDRVLVANGDGRGGFGGTRPFATSGQPVDVAAGYFNNDRFVDLAVAAVSDGVVSILLQTSAGTGAFEAPRNVTVGDTPIDIEVIDVNCDGRDDLVVANTADDTVSVLRNNGSATFTVSQTLPAEIVGDLPDSIGVGDFDSDGMDDIAVSNGRAAGGQRSVRFFYGTCQGTLDPRSGSSNLSAGLLVTALTARDFTGDQIVDIGVVNQTSNVVRSFLGLGSNGAGTGNFSARPEDVVSRMPEVLASGDFDDDGRYDMVAGNTDASANNVTLLLNCARDAECDPFGFSPAGEAASRGDANDDGVRSAADIAAIAAEVIDGDGRRVEEVENGFFAGVAGADANGDGRVDEQDVRAAARRIFAGG